MLPHQKFHQAMSCPVCWLNRQETSASVPGYPPKVPRRSAYQLLNLESQTNSALSIAILQINQDPPRSVALFHPTFRAFQKENTTFFWKKTPTQKISKITPNPSYPQKKQNVFQIISDLPQRKKKPPPVPSSTFERTLGSKSSPWDASTECSVVGPTFQPIFKNTENSPEVFFFEDWIPTVLLPRSLTVRTWKWMVGRRSFPFGKAYFQGLCWF